MVVNDVTLPFVGALQFPNTGGVLTRDLAGRADERGQLLRRGRRAGRRAVRDRRRSPSRSSPSTWASTVPAILAALTAGASLGFLFHNFHPASVFMGDSGANLLGYLLGVGRGRRLGQDQRGRRPGRPAGHPGRALPGHRLRVAKRLKYHRKPWSADANHFHHRMARIGFSQRKTVAYLYAWTTAAGRRGRGPALRPLPRPHRRAPHYHLGWLLVMVAPRCGRSGRQRLPRLRPRDPQVPEPAGARSAPPRPRTPPSTRSTSGWRTTSRPASSSACDSAAMRTSARDDLTPFIDPRRLHDPRAGRPGLEHRRAPEPGRGDG